MTSLSPCPDSPNCVYSQAVDARHAIAPFPIMGNPQDDLKRIAAIIESMPRTEIVEITPTYLHAEFTSKMFRFTDDVEFLVNTEQNVIDVRSASRVGYGDLGVNRKRIERIRAIYSLGG